MLCSSVSPPDTHTRRQNCANVATFIQSILATNILYNQLVDYMWESYLAKIQQNNWDKCGRTQLQKGGVVYSHDIDRNIVGAEMQAWESLNLTADQKLYRLLFKYSVLPSLLLRTKQRKQQANQTATNLLRRTARRQINQE